MHWLSRLAQALAAQFAWPVPENHLTDRDTDARRVRSELDAIRIRFPDTA